MVKRRAKMARASFMGVPRGNYSTGEEKFNAEARRAQRIGEDSKRAGFG
jgi:hypothetical protein